MLAEQPLSAATLNSPKTVQPCQLCAGTTRSQMKVFRLQILLQRQAILTGGHYLVSVLRLFVRSKPR